MENKTSLFVKLGYIYLILPVIIFIFGYCKLPIAIAGGILIAVSSYFVFKNSLKLWKPDNGRQQVFLAVVFLISLVWVYSSGIGALVFQNFDHNCRNPIFELLTTQDWPVVVADNKMILTYYTGFWMVPAVIGKLFQSVDIGYYAQIVWASTGVFLVFYYMLASLKKKNFMPVLVFIFFSGMDYIGASILQNFAEYNDFYNPNNIVSHLEWWFPGFQFSSMTTQLYWVFNQAIPAWVLTMLLYNSKSNRSTIFLYSCILLCSTLPAIGIFPFILFWCLKNGEEDLKKLISKEHIKNAIKSALSIENITGIVFILPVIYMYLSNNISGGTIGAVPLTFSRISCVFYLFLMMEVGFYLILIFKLNKHNPLYYICMFCFAAYPFYYIGHSVDFCMRATIPALVILSFMIIQALENEDFKNNNKKLYITLVICLLFGALTPIHEIARTIINTSKGITKAKSELGIENFFGTVENNNFVKYISRFKQ